MVNALSLTYELATEPSWGGILTTSSHLTNKKINRFTHIPQTQNDLVDRIRMMQKLAMEHGSCVGGRCVGQDALCAVYSVTYDIDQEKGTDYHERFIHFLSRVQDEDLCVAGAMTDAKGNRSLTPIEQDDPDIFLRLVEKRADGIVVRGAKAHISQAAFAHEMLILPSEAMNQTNKAYAISFAISPDAPGITHVFEGAAPNQRRKTASEIDFGNANYGVHGATLVIFDDVFIPNERIFMCEEYQFSGSMVVRFADMHRLGFAACKSGHCRLTAGACALAAEYNGVEKAAHIKEKLTDIILNGDLTFGTVLGSATLGYPSPSGTYFPDRSLVNSAKIQGVSSLWEIGKIASDIVGGIVCTAPTGKDLESPEVGQWVKKYYRGKSPDSAEKRIRLARLVEFLIGQGSIIPAEGANGGGGIATQRLSIRGTTNFDELKQKAKKIAGIE